jgi:hypothetical protein
VAWHQFSQGKHHSGEIVGVHVTDPVVEVWAADDLIKTIVPISTKEVRTEAGGHRVCRQPRRGRRPGFQT